MRAGVLDRSRPPLAFLLDREPNAAAAIGELAGGLEVARRLGQPDRVAVNEDGTGRAETVSSWAGFSPSGRIASTACHERGRSSLPSNSILPRSTTHVEVVNLPDHVQNLAVRIASPMDRRGVGVEPQLGIWEALGSAGTAGLVRNIAPVFVTVMPRAGTPRARSVIARDLDPRRSAARSLTGEIVSEISRAAVLALPHALEMIRPLAARIGKMSTSSLTVLGNQHRDQAADASWRCSRRASSPLVVVMMPFRSTPIASWDDSTMAACLARPPQPVARGDVDEHVDAARDRRRREERSGFGSYQMRVVRTLGRNFDFRTMRFPGMIAIARSLSGIGSAVGTAQLPAVPPRLASTGVRPENSRGRC
jgi:hypothetical protein